MLLLQHQYHFENYRIREHYCSLLALTDRTNSTFQSYQNLWLSSKCFNDVIISIFNNKLVDQRLAKSKSAEGLRSRNWYFIDVVLILHFPNDWLCWVSFHVLIGCLCIFFEEMCIQIACLRFSWICLFIVEL